MKELLKEMRHNAGSLLLWDDVSFNDSNKSKKEYSKRLNKSICKMLTYLAETIFWSAILYPAIFIVSSVKFVAGGR